LNHSKIKNSKYTIVKFHVKYLNEIQKLYKISYERTKPLKYFRHRLLKSPWGKPITYIMKFENKIVGFYSIHPIKITINNKLTLAGYSFLTMTHPNHSGKGIFTSLAKKTYKESKKKGYQFIFGFANENSFPGDFNNLCLKYFNGLVRS